MKTANQYIISENKDTVHKTEAKDMQAKKENVYVKGPTKVRENNAFLAIFC